MTEFNELKKHMYIGFSVVFLSILSIAYYTFSSVNSLDSSIQLNFKNMQEVINHNLSTIKSNLNDQLSGVNKSLILFQSEVFDSLTNVERGLREELQNESKTIKANFSSKISLVEQIVDTTSKEHKEKLSELSSTIQKVESGYTEKLELLKAELSALNISSIDITTPDFSDTIIKAMPSVVSVITNKGQASGVFITNKEVITNYHVVSGSNNISILTNKGISYPVIIKFYNETIDLALLETQTDDTFQNLNLASISDIKLGSQVIAVGNPYGLGFSVTEGIISGLNRIGPNGLPIYVQTDVSVNPGNSGGPVININGEIIGITTFKVSNSEGLGFAISSDYIKDFVKS